MLPIKHITQAVEEEITYIENRKSGEEKSLKTSWKCFNAAGLNGLTFNEVNLIGGLSGSGKSLIINQLETALFELNKDIDFIMVTFTFEMSARRQIGRKFSTKLKKSIQQLYSADIENKAKNISDKGIDEAKNVGNELSKYPIYYVEIPGTLEEMEQVLKHIANTILKPGQGMIVSMDHTLLAKKIGQQTTNTMLYDLADKLNLWKKIFPACFIVLSQLNRSIESEERMSTIPSKLHMHYPKKEDFSHSDGLFQCADLVMISHKPNMLNLPFYGTNKDSTNDTDIYWHFLKTRNSSPFFTKMRGDFEHMEIHEC